MTNIGLHSHRVSLPEHRRFGYDRSLIIYVLDGPGSWATLMKPANEFVPAENRAPTTEPVRFPEVEDSQVERVTAQLDQNGIVTLPPLVSESQLSAMQRAFEARLHRVRWNDLDGYEKELFRHVVQDVLTLDQGFLDIALHPLVKGSLRRYLGSAFALVEAKGWKSLPTKRDFHGWHGDAWYDQEILGQIPREVKLGFYLSDVKSGPFNYIKGSHRKQHPRMVRNEEVHEVVGSEVLELTGRAGTAFLFDTSGTHRQQVPILEPRQAVFYNYHDPSVRLQKESEDYYRYHPLILNTAFLGSLSGEDQRILGFGNKARYQPAFYRADTHVILQRIACALHSAALHIEDLRYRVRGGLKRLFARRG